MSPLLEATPTPGQLAPVWPAHVHKHDPQMLQRLYAHWLASPRPSAPDKRVASHKNAAWVARGRALAEATSDAWKALRATWDQHPGRVWIWSDLHLGHRKICRYAERPFQSAQHMNDVLLANAMERVAPEDWLLFLGDTSFLDFPDTQAWLAQCPGHKALVLGNHERDGQWALTHPDPRDLGFEAVAETVDWVLETPVADADQAPVRRLWFTHYPLWSGWIPEDTRCVHGHIHQHRIGGRLINASVEHTGYAPMPLLSLVRGSSTHDQASAASFADEPEGDLPPADRPDRTAPFDTVSDTSTGK